MMNGDLPKAGSSAIAILSALTLPERIDKLRLPTVTWRPSALLASDSTFVGAYFYIEHSSPYGGSVGFPLN